VLKGGTAVQVFLDQMYELVGGYVPKLVGAVVLLVVGWLVALGVSAIVRRALRRTTLDNRVAAWVVGEGRGEALEVEQWIGRGVFYLIMVFVLAAFFQALGLTVVTQPLNQLLVKVFEYIPRIGGAAVIAVVAWVVASVLRFAVEGLLTRAGVDERFRSGAGLEDEEAYPLSETLAQVVFWLVLLLFLPAVLGALKLEGLLEPVQGMISKMLEFVPNIFAAAVILGVGWFAARVLQRIVTNLLAAAGVDGVSDRVGLAAVLGEQRLSGVVGLVVHVLVLIPVLIAGLNALKLDALTEPASAMLTKILTAVPSIFAAGLLLLIAYVVGKVVAGLVTNVLGAAGFDAILAKLGIGRGPAEGERTPSEVVGYLVMVAIMLFASIEALGLLRFALVAELVTQFTVLAGRVILGLIIFAIALYFANVASTAIEASGVAQAGLLALGSRVAILVLGGAMGLREMGLANEIINLGFGVLLAAVGLALALAFGLGGREVAGRQLEEWVESKKS
jgi:hypothetical protein